MKYINRITFDKIKAQWEILKMRAAYIEAEQEIIRRASEGNDETWVVSYDPPDPPEGMSPEEWHAYEVDGMGNMRNLTPKDLIKRKLNALEEQGRKLLEEEKYELFAELKEIYERYKKEYDRL